MLYLNRFLANFRLMVPTVQLIVVLLIMKKETVLVSFVKSLDIYCIEIYLFHCIIVLLLVFLFLHMNVHVHVYQIYYKTNRSNKIICFLSVVAGNVIMFRMRHAGIRADKDLPF